jgi:L-lactate dehydrogenase complex protein LldE
MNVNIFIPCFMDQLYPDTAFSMISILEQADCKVHYHTNQSCCGQPGYTTGQNALAKEIARKVLSELNPNYPTVCPGASCTAMIRNDYPDLFKNTVNHNSANTIASSCYELSEFLVKISHKTNFGAKFPAKVHYHDACSALRACKIHSEPRKLLSKVAGLELIETSDQENCCGFGGSFSIKFEPASVAMAKQKIELAIQAGAEYITSTDLSCLIHLDAVIKKGNYPIKTIHLADLLCSKMK